MLFDTKFDLIVSIGEDCACTSYLRRFNLQDYSFPFDWLTKATFETRINLLINNFENFLNKESLQHLTKPVGVNVDNEHDYYQDINLGFYFYHDFKSNEPFDEEYINVKNKYERRIKRLYQCIEEVNNILFVWWSRDKHQDEDLIINLYEKLKNRFKNKKIHLLIIEYNEKNTAKYLCDKNILISSYDNISFKHNPKWNETMGNETNNLRLFSQIKKRRDLGWYLKMFVYKFGKIFINLIPNRKFRHCLKQAWSYKFFKDKL